MLKDIVVKNRSYRGFDESVKQTKEELMALVDHARQMPAMKNAQPFKYFLATDPETVAAIQPHTKWAGLLPELGLPVPGTRPTSFIVILQDTEIEPVLAQFMTDSGIASATITLAAAEAGLGCCMIHNYGATGVLEAIKTPKHLKPIMVIAVGKPIEDVRMVEIVDGKTAYYRDENNVHYVPKRPLSEIIL